MKKIKCLKCGSRNVAEYLWGMFTFTEQFEQDINAGNVVLGGCCIITESNSKYYCNDCKKDFGAPFVKWLKNGELFDYAMNMTHEQYQVMYRWLFWWICRDGIY